MADEKLESFISTIREDAQREKEALDEEIASKREAFLSKAEDELLDEVYAYIRTATSRIRTDAGRRVSQKMFEEKRELYRHRTEVALSVAEDAKRRIAEYTETPEYRERLVRLAKYAASKLGGGEVHIFLRREDMPLAAEISEACGAEVSEGGFTLGGLIAENPERHLRLDLSYDESLARTAQSFGTIVANDRVM